MSLDDDLEAVPPADEHEIELLGSVELVAGFQCGEPGGFDALSSSLTQMFPWSHHTVTILRLG